mmetsp:Transcript_57007/g.169604  ORF Transcript_57007/g.169604 Transcript_57007/m.169604 type:complete len:302 (+) Transcript_57007:481-1386(+)
MHQRVLLSALGVRKPSYGIVEGQRPLRRLGTRRPVTAVVGQTLVLLLGPLHRDLDAAPALHFGVLPVVGPLVLLRWQLDFPMDEGKVVLLCTPLLNAVLAGKLPADLSEAILGLSTDHDSGGFLVQTVAAPRLREGTVVAGPACATELRLLLLPPLPGAHGVLVVELERQVLVDLDLGLLAVKQGGRTLRSSPGWHGGVVRTPAISAGVEARLVDAEDLVRLAEELGWEPASPDLSGEDVDPVVVDGLCGLLLQHVLHTQCVELLRPKLVEVDNLLQHALCRLPCITPPRVRILRLNRLPH